MTELYEKVAIITGSSRGIGAGIALSLARAGAKVVINYVHNRQAADEVCMTITQMGGKCTAIQADVSNPDDVRRLFDAAIENFGHIDILVNNAGILVFKKSPKSLMLNLTIFSISILKVFSIPCAKQPDAWLTMAVSSIFPVQ